jgi:hypothetical protein
MLGTYNSPKISSSSSDDETPGRLRYGRTILGKDHSLVTGKRRAYNISKGCAIRSGRRLACQVLDVTGELIMSPSTREAKSKPQAGAEQTGAKQAYESPAVVFVPNEPIPSTGPKKGIVNPSDCNICCANRIIEGV